ncbi:TPA: hypothetical protein BOS_18880 [Bos taurus]|nr:TPA: hypothetical protein BOS_18880 [Bos taurus]
MGLTAELACDRRMAVFIAHLGFTLAQLPAGHQEDLDVDDQHDEQWGQDAAEEVEVHHVAHGHHVFEETPDEAAAHVRGCIPRLCAVGGNFSVVPPQERCQANAKGQDPEGSNDSSRSGPSDQTLIPERDAHGQVSVDGHGQEAEDGALREHQHKAGEEEAAVEVGAEAQADGDGEGDGEQPHGHVGRGQRHQKVVGGRLQRARGAHRRAHQHVAGHRQRGQSQLQRHVHRVLRLQRHRRPARLGLAPPGFPERPARARSSACPRPPNAGLPTTPPPQHRVFTASPSQRSLGSLVTPVELSPQAEPQILALRPLPPIGLLRRTRPKPSRPKTKSILSPAQALPAPTPRTQ